MSDVIDRKRVAISVKRQFTIPQKYYEVLGFESDAECTLLDGGIFIRPLRDDPSDFSEHILADLIGQGLSGQELLAQFKIQSKKVRPAILKMITEADKEAESNRKETQNIDDLFALVKL
ncbi:MAG TPA: hypothetical protein VJ861_05790 [Treponemataceae bacterium]|nr:hypothetical protein [Treponemataceae bacterium]